MNRTESRGAWLPTGGRRVRGEIQAKSRRKSGRFAENRRSADRRSADRRSAELRRVGGHV